MDMLGEGGEGLQGLISRCNDYIQFLQIVNEHQQKIDKMKNDGNEQIENLSPTTKKFSVKAKADIPASAHINSNVQGPSEIMKMLD